MKKIPSKEFIFKLQQIENFCQRGLFDNAINDLKKLIKDHKNDHILKNFLGKIYLHKGMIDDAITSFKNTLKLEPKFIEAHFNLANCFAQKGDHNLSITHLTICIENNLINEHIYNNLAAAYLVKHEFDKTIEYSKKALELNQNFPNALKNCGTAYFMRWDKNSDSGKTEQDLEKILINELDHPDKIKAKSYFTKYLELVKTDGSIYSYMGLMDTEFNFTSAKENFLKAIELNQESFKDYRGLANLYGHFDKSEEALNYELKAYEYLVNQYVKNDKLKLEQDCVLNIMKYQNHLGRRDDILNWINNLVSFEDHYFIQTSFIVINYLDQIDIDSELVRRHFQLEKKNLKNLDKSVLMFNIASIHKKLKNDEEYFKYLELSNTFRIKSLYEEANMELRKQLNVNFEDVKYRFNRISKINLDIDENNELNPIFVVGMPRSSTTLTELILSNHPNVFGCGEVDFFVKRGKFLTNRLKLLEPSDNEVQEYLLRCRSLYLQMMKDMKGNEKFIVDKMPFNERYIDIIVKIFPNAKIINTNRDPIAVSWSIYSNFFGSNIEWVTSQKEIVAEYHEYLKSMNFFKDKFSDNIFDLYYDNLINDSKKTIQKLLDFCGLEWNDNCLNPDKNTKTIRTISAQQGRKGIYKGSTMAWKKYEKYIGVLVNGFNH